MIELKTPHGDAFVRPDVVVTILDQQGVGVMTQDGMGEVRSVLVTSQGLQIPTYHKAKELFELFFGPNAPVLIPPPEDST